MPTWAPYTAENKAGMEFTSNGPVPGARDSEFDEFIKEWLNKKGLEI